MAEIVRLNVLPRIAVQDVFWVLNVWKLCRMKGFEVKDCEVASSGRLPQLETSIAAL